MTPSPARKTPPPAHLFRSELLGRKKSPPKYARQRRLDSPDLAYVRIDTKRHYLGPYGSPESRQRYDRLIAEYLSHGKINGPEVRDTITVEEVAEQYTWFAQRYYVKDGQPTAEPGNIALALRWLIDKHGNMPARKFGPKALREVQDQLVQQQHTRKYINRHIERIKRMFKWAVAEELVPASVYHGLQALSGLRFGRTEAPEPVPVQPVPEQLIEPVKQFVSRQVAAMIDLQLLTGARPGEMLILRPCDIDIRGEVWVYVPARHKTQHHGRQRVIPLGPKAQAILKPFLEGRASESYVFSPKDAETQRYTELHAHRKTPNNQGNHAGDKKAGRPPRELGMHYDRTSYARAIARACGEAFPLPEELRPPSRRWQADDAS